MNLKKLKLFQWLSYLCFTLVFLIGLILSFLWVMAHLALTILKYVLGNQIKKRKEISDLRIGFRSRIPEVLKRLWWRVLFLEVDLFQANYITRKHLKLALENTQKPQYSIDIGSGEGENSRFLSKYFEEVVAVEIDPKFVKRSKSHGKKTRVDHVIGDARCLPLTSNCFDFLLCTEVLEHIKQDSKVLSEISRVTNDKAPILIMTPNKDFFRNYEYPLTKFWKRIFPKGTYSLLGIFAREQRVEKYARHHAHVRIGYSPSEFRRIMQKYPLEVNRIDHIGKRGPPALLTELSNLIPDEVGPIFSIITIPLFFPITYFDYLTKGDGFHIVVQLKSTKNYQQKPHGTYRIQ